MAKITSLPLTVVDEPPLPMRTRMLRSGIDALVESIRAVGLLEPIGVIPSSAGRYECVYGLRRVIAARAAGLERIPVVVHADLDTAHAAKVHENVIREDVSAADEAVYYGHLYEQHGRDVDKVAHVVRRSRDYVEQRLLLLQGDPDVLAALAEGELTLGVGLELNKIESGQERAYYLHYARTSGATVRQMRTWRTEANVRAQLARATASGGGENAAAGTTEPVSSVVPGYAAIAAPQELSGGQELRPCLFCGEAREEWKMFRKWVCVPCADRHLVPDTLERGARAHAERQHVVATRDNGLRTTDDKVGDK